MKALLLILLCMVMLTCRKDVTQSQFVEVIDTLYTDWEVFAYEPPVTDGMRWVNWDVYPDMIVIDFDGYVGSEIRCKDEMVNCPYKEIRLSHLAIADDEAGTIWPRFYVATYIDSVYGYEICAISDTFPDLYANPGDAPQIESGETKYVEYSLSGPWPETATIGIKMARVAYGRPGEAPGTLTLTDLCVVGIREELAQ